MTWVVAMVARVWLWVDDEDRGILVYEVLGGLIINDRFKLSLILKKLMLLSFSITTP